ncbi:MAG: hypothetical protein IIU14_02355 [Ruminococcus sp.]|nr:hypothetical protein [Ruminococcus sp.]
MKKYLFLLVFCAAFVLSSCAPAVANQADEIRLNRWSAQLRGERRVSLSFREDFGCLEISEKEKSTKIQGLCVIDKETLAIFDSGDKQCYRFDYSLKENKLRLSGDYGSLSLKRN